MEPATPPTTATHASYTVTRAPELLSLDDDRWHAAPALAVDQFLPMIQQEQRPVVRFRLTHTGRAIQVRMSVQGDRALRSVCTTLNGDVYEDSCVEAFLRPRPDRPLNDGGGYFNFEVNAGGTLHVSYVEDPSHVPNGLKKRTLLSAEQVQSVGIVSTLPPVIEPERGGSNDWTILLTVPLSVLEQYVGRLPDLGPGVTWSANFYKCGSNTSLPHWASWQPILNEVYFHQPDKFGQLRFA